MIFEFEENAAVPLSYNSQTKEFLLDPSLEDLDGTTVSKQAKFYFEDFPDRVWRAPIELNISKCYNNNKEAVACGEIPADGQI